MNLRVKVSTAHNLHGKNCDCECVNFVVLRNYAVGGSVNCGDTPSCPRRVTRPAESKPNLGTAGWPPATLDSQTQSTPRPLDL